MKKKILAVAALAVSLSAFSQEKALKQNGFWDNWFIQGQVGANVTFSEGFKDASLFKDLVSPHAAVSVGKYFSPISGARLQVAGWESKNYVVEYNDNYKVQFAEVNADGLLNFTNLFLGYNPDRKFSFVGIAGIGYVHGFKDSKAYVGKKGETIALGTSHSVSPRLGFQLDYKTSEAVSLNLEAVGNVIHDKFNGIEGGTKYDGLGNLMLGVTYRFNKRGFDVVDVVDPSEMNRLNQMINDQKRNLADKDSQLNGLNSQVRDKDNEIAQLKDALGKKPTVTTELKEEVEMNALVVFKLGKSELQDNQEINIFNAAQYFKQNPNMDVIITGYADKSTGSAEVNKRISMQRAQAVADILINKYGIDKSRVTTKAFGDTKQPFVKDEWNRVAIFTAVKKK